MKGKRKQNSLKTINKTINILSLARPEAQQQHPSSPSAVDGDGGGSDSNGASTSRKRVRSEGNDVEPSLQAQEQLDLNSLKTYGEAPACNECAFEDSLLHVQPRSFLPSFLPSSLWGIKEMGLPIMKVNSL